MILQYLDGVVNYNKKNYRKMLEILISNTLKRKGTSLRFTREKRTRGGRGYRLRRLPAAVSGWP